MNAFASIEAAGHCPPPDLQAGLVAELAAEVPTALVPERPELVPEPDAFLQVGLVRLWGRDLAIAAEHVREVVPRPKQVHPGFATAAALAGSIVVRGQVIPLVDVSGPLGFTGDEPAPEVVVVIRRDRQLIGLLVHSVLGLTRVRSGDVQPFLFDPAEPAHIVASSFALGDRLVGIVDTAAILNLPGVPRARDGQRIGHGSAAIGRRKLLVLSVAGAELALDATMVVATLPARQVRPGPSVSNDWAGVIDYLDLEIPVIDDLALIGLSGRAADTKDTLVVILRLSEDHLLGLKADQVRRIIPVHDADIEPLPPQVAARLPLFEGAVGDGGGGQSLLLRSDGLIGSDDLRMIAALTRRKGGAVAIDAIAALGKPAAGITKGAQAYLIFRAGALRRASTLADVTQIIALPKTHSALTCPGSPLRGLASHLGKSLTLVDFCSGEPPHGARNEDKAVIIVKVGDSAAGFIVDRLETVTRAVPQAVPGANPNDDDGATFIQVRIDGAEEAIRICRLEHEVSRLFSLNR